MSEAISNHETLNSEPVTFTPEQQVKVDEIIRNAMGRAAADTRRENAELQKQVNDLTEKYEKAQAAGGSQSELQAQFLELQKKVAEKDAAVAVAREENERLHKTQLISNCCSDTFVDVGVVTAMTERNIRKNSETGQFEVVNQDGSLKLSPKTFEPITLPEFFADFAEQKPFLVKSTARGGNGSSASSQSSLGTGRGQFEPEQIFGRKSDARLANDLIKKNPSEYRRLRVEAVKKRLI